MPMYQLQAQDKSLSSASGLCPSELGGEDRYLPGLPCSSDEEGPGMCPVSRGLRGQQEVEFHSEGGRGRDTIPAHCAQPLGQNPSLFGLNSQPGVLCRSPS